MWIQIKGQRRRATGAPPNPRLHGGCVGKRRHRRASRGAGRRDTVGIVKCEDFLKKAARSKFPDLKTA